MKIKAIRSLEIISIGILSIIAFFIPINHAFLSPLIVLWSITSLIYLLLNKSKMQINKSLIALIGFYFLLIVGLLWTDNIKAGFFDLEVKLSLIIFPLFFLFLQYRIKFLKWIIYSFILGLLLSSVLLLYDATLNFLIWPSYTYYFYVELSKQLHPTYISLYFVTGIAIMLVELSSNEPILFKKKFIPIVLIFYFFIFNILLLSKIGIISAIIFLLFFLTKWGIKSKKIILPILIVISLSSVFYISYKKSSYFQQRVKEMMISISPEDEQKNNGSTAIRIKIWKQSLNLILEKPLLGYGTGDVKDALLTQYKKVGMQNAYDKKLNAHNQFLQVSISLGIIGLFLFCYSLFKSVKNGIEKNNMYIVVFVILFILFSLTESILENQAGTIFFGLFFSLFNAKSLFINEN